MLARFAFKPDKAPPARSIASAKVVVTSKGTIDGFPTLPKTQIS
jgi:hypothetical protein